MEIIYKENKIFFSIENVSIINTKNNIMNICNNPEIYEEKNKYKKIKLKVNLYIPNVV